MSNNNYKTLLSEVAPQVINSEEEYERIEAIFAALIKKDRSPDEDKLFDLLATLMEDYESRTLAPLEKTTPLEALKFLLEENNLRQKDVVSLFGSQGIASEVLSGKREISKIQAKRLAKRFSVSVELFI